MSQCYNVTMLQCYNVTMLQCYNVTMSQFHKAMLQYYNVKEWRNMTLRNVNRQLISCQPYSMINHNHPVISTTLTTRV